jgi:hypothetical protein
MKERRLWQTTKAVLVAGSVCAALTLAACSGSDGKNGATGATGPSGPQGAS